MATPTKKKTTEAEDLQAVLESIESFPESHRKLTRRVHELILEARPDLKPRLFYGMPGYAKSKSQPILIFFRVDDGFMTLGITEKAQISLEPNSSHKLIPTSWHLQELDDATEQEILSIVEKSCGSLT